MGGSVMSIQFIADGRNGRDERVILWRTGDYTYELEIGTGIYRRLVTLLDTEYYDALEQFDAAVMNYQDLEAV
jgi:hypothetical protein